MEDGQAGGHGGELGMQEDGGNKVVVPSQLASMVDISFEMYRGYEDLRDGSNQLKVCIVFWCGVYVCVVLYFLYMLCCICVFLYYLVDCADKHTHDPPINSQHTKTLNTHSLQHTLPSTHTPLNTHRRMIYFTWCWVIGTGIYKWVNLWKCGYCMPIETWYVHCLVCLCMCVVLYVCVYTCIYVYVFALCLHCALQCCIGSCHVLSACMYWYWYIR